MSELLPREKNFVHLHNHTEYSMLDGAARIDEMFEVAAEIIDAGLVPILEPEVDIHAPDKAEAEALLKKYLLEGLESIPEGKYVMFKLTLPEQDDFYRELVEHPRVLKVVALSGGVFVNTLISSGSANALSARGFTVLRHHRVPPTDAGLALGQLAVLAHTGSRRDDAADTGIDASPGDVPPGEEEPCA